MSAVHNSVETVNAAATAIVTAESRVQPTAVNKKRWGSCWSLYWCFGSHKQNKKIGHAVLVPETVVAGAAAALVTENMARPTTLLLPFIAPPSSPASFLQSDPPSATQSPAAGLLSLSSLPAGNAYSSGPATIFAVGPYAHDTQLVSPPVFSTFTTEPSTASFTPPPEPVQLTTTPSSPEVPFAQLLASSLCRARRNCGVNQKFSLSQYDYQPYPHYQGSPVGHLISSGLGVPNSGTSSPFPGKSPTAEIHIGEVPKLLGFEYFSTGKWGSRLGSGSLTPDGMEPVSRDSYLPENQTSEGASQGNFDTRSQNEDDVINHRVSFELTGHDVASCLAMDPVSLAEKVSQSLQDTAADSSTTREAGGLIKIEHVCEYCGGGASNEMPNKVPGEGDEQCPLKHRAISLGSVKEFNFDNRKEEVSDKRTLNSEWWANEKVVVEELGPHNKWTFFPMVQSGAS